MIWLSNKADLKSFTVYFVVVRLAFVATILFYLGSHAVEGVYSHHGITPGFILHRKDEVGLSLWMFNEGPLRYYEKRTGPVAKSTDLADNGIEHAVIQTSYDLDWRLNSGGVSVKYFKDWMRSRRKQPGQVLLGSKTESGAVYDTVVKAFKMQSWSSYVAEEGISFEHGGNEELVIRQLYRSKKSFAVMASSQKSHTQGEIINILISPELFSKVIIVLGAGPVVRKYQELYGDKAAEHLQRLEATEYPKELPDLEIELYTSVNDYDVARASFNLLKIDPDHKKALEALWLMATSKRARSNLTAALMLYKVFSGRNLEDARRAEVEKIILNLINQPELRDKTIDVIDRMISISDFVPSSNMIRSLSQKVQIQNPHEEFFAFLRLIKKAQGSLKCNALFGHF